MSEAGRFDPEQETFATVIVALASYLNDLVVAGGWAHRLYLLDHRASQPSFEPLATHDADFVIPAKLVQRAKPIDALLGELGFEEELGGDSSPPVTRYVRDNFEVEFITHLRGSENKRGKPDVTLLAAGVTAQKLRYVDLLAESPWTVYLAEARGYPVGPTPIGVRIPNPVSFIAQKLLSFPTRVGFNKRVKDVLYVHDTLTQFRDALAILKAEWSLVRAGQHPSLVGRLREQSEAVFAPNSLYISPATALARSTGRPDVPTPARFASTCRDALREIFELHRST